MRFNTRCLVCDVAWALQLSEQAFYKRFNKGEREQLVATYQSKQHREWVVTEFPIKSGRVPSSRPKGKRGWRSRK